MLNTKASKTRFQSAPWMDFNDYFTIIGVGGIGSWTAYLLTKIGYKCHIYDDDTLDELNMGSQFYSNKFVKQPKVDAFKSTLALLSKDDSENIILTTSARYKEGDTISDFLLCCVDNMSTRKLSSEEWYKKQCEAEWMNPCLYIDSRMDAEYYEVFCIYNEETYQRYVKTLFEDSAVADAPCSFKSTPQTAALISGTIVTCVVNHITNINDEIAESIGIRSVPFHIEQATPIHYINVEE